jgi:hypothetical protein
MDHAMRDIERAIEALTPAQQEELYVWLEQRYSRSIDAQLKVNLDAGRMDDRINRAVADHRAGRTEPL